MKGNESEIDSTPNNQKIIIHSLSRMNGESCSHQAVELGWKRLAVGGWMDKWKEFENFEISIREEERG